MASVPLRFTPPEIEDVVSMKVYESPTMGGTYLEIEEVTGVGTFPGYISHYTTDQATSRNYWFAISWVDSKGAESDLSAPIQGGEETLVGKIVTRVMQRDVSVSVNIATQEAEAAISKYFNVLDAFSVDPATVSPSVLSGLVNLTLVRSYLTRIITASGSSSKWVAGIVSMDDSSQTKGQVANIEALLRLANADLGLQYSVVFLMKEITVAGGYKRLTGVDLSRGIFELG